MTYDLKAFEDFEQFLNNQPWWKRLWIAWTTFLN